MKRAAIIATLAIALSLAGCRGHRAATLRAGATACVDTTRTTLDTIGHRSETTDTSAAMSSITAAATVRFVDGGGMVSIDSAGRITLRGVDSIDAVLATTHATDRDRKRRSSDLH